MKKSGIQSAAALSLLILLAVILGVGSAIWGDYRDEIMKNQKEQLLTTSKILAENMELSLSEYHDSLVFLSRMDDAPPEGNIYETYLETKSSFESDIFWEDERGIRQKFVNGLSLGNPILITDMGNGESIFQYEDESARKYLVFKKRLHTGQYLCLAVDEEQYYRELISRIQIGTNGYIVVKNSKGLILMHPEREQWGIHVIEGRKKIYPDLDYASLEAMIMKQNKGKEGLSEYYSYWWSSSSLSKVKKIGAYAPVKVADDFWVISAVVDYDDFCAPVEAGFWKVSLLFIGTLAVLGALALVVGKLLWERKRNLEEIAALHELNEKLEEIHKGEERLAHQQRLQVMGTMTGGIVHEFNNFLTPIMGHAELLMMGFSEDSDMYDSAKEIYEASEKAKEVVRQIASLSRRNVETVYQSIEADKLCARVFKMVESICPAQICLEKEIRLDGGHVFWEMQRRSTR